MKTKLFAALLALVLTLALAGCHKTENVDVSTTVPTATEAVETTTEAEKTKEAEETSETVSKTVIKNQISLAGTWEDKVSQRAVLEVRGGQNQTYQLHVHWGDSAFTSDDWTMTGTFNDSTGELTYKNCTRKTITFDENGGTESEDVHYTNGTGKFIYKNGELSWQADNDSDVNICVFKK